MIYKRISDTEVEFFHSCGIRAREFRQMIKLIDGKYQIIAPHAGDILIINELSQAIPEDEPMILFRARDWHAVAMLHFYLQICIEDNCTSRHIVGIQKRIAAFNEFKRDHPERMKQPGITEGK